MGDLLGVEGRGFGRGGRGRLLSSVSFRCRRICRIRLCLEFNVCNGFQQIIIGALEVTHILKINV